MSSYLTGYNSFFDMNTLINVMISGHSKIFINCLFILYAVEMSESEELCRSSTELSQNDLSVKEKEEKLSTQKKASAIIPKSKHY